MITLKKNGQKVWVTFTMPSADHINDVVISGEWNDWAEEPLKQKKNGDFYITKVLRADNSYQFGYKINGDYWFIEEECESVSSPYGSQNSLLSV
jgi:hypothetical protein